MPRAPVLTAQPNRALCRHTTADESGYPRYGAREGLFLFSKVGW